MLFALDFGARSSATLIFALDKDVDKMDNTKDAPEATSSHKKTVAVIMMGGPTKGLCLIRFFGDCEHCFEYRSANQTKLIT